MINEDLIEKAVTQIIKASGMFPNVLYEGQNIIPGKPFLTWALVPLAVDDPTLGRTAPTWTGLISAGIVTDLGRLPSQDRALVRQFCNLFPATRTIPLGDGTLVRVTDHPFAGMRYRDAGGYRHPITVQLRSDNVD